MINYYTVLEIDPKASKEQIKEAYKRISVKVHPDKNDGDEYYVEIFKTVNEAQQILTDEAKRAAYDDELRRSFKYPLGRRSNFLGINFNLSRTWIFLLSLTAGFVTFVILLPSSDLKELEQQKALMKLTASNSILKKSTKVQKQIQQAPLIASANETARFEGKGQQMPEKLQLLNQRSTGQNRRAGTKVALATISEVEKGLADSSSEMVVPDQPPLELEMSPIQHAAAYLSQSQFSGILEQVNATKTSANNKINCVRVLKTKNSNVENAFEIATYLRSKGYIISGRDIAYREMEGLEVKENGQCICVTIGTF
jgi:curved DNA-binding protein CbpA